MPSFSLSATQVGAAAANGDGITERVTIRAAVPGDPQRFFCRLNATLNNRWCFCLKPIAISSNPNITSMTRHTLPVFMIAAALAIAPLSADDISALAVPRDTAVALPATRLAAYRAELDSFRKEYGGARELPDVRFFLFGMGLRSKFIYRDGKLLDAGSGTIIREWKLGSDVILPADYQVDLQTAEGSKITIREDEEAVWIEENGQCTALDGTRRPLKLPSFSENKFPRVLRVLHHELLVNVTLTGPVPNFFVYQKPWYRDGAMMALAFRATGNLAVIRDWILGLSDPYDRNNRGETEADNLGQALFLISLVGDKNHPLVAKVLAEVPRFEVKNGGAKYIKGRTDFNDHPAYQTKWLKYGLRSLGLPDPYTVPSLEDGYSALFWMDYKDIYVKGKDSDDRGEYPYLGWACDNFHGTKKSPIGNRDYPLTWEQNAVEANYKSLITLDPRYVEQRISAPHTWHAAEAFLYVLAQPLSGAR